MDGCALGMRFVARGRFGLDPLNIRDFADWLAPSRKGSYSFRPPHLIRSRTLPPALCELFNCL